MSLQRQPSRNPGSALFSVNDPAYETPGPEGENIHTRVQELLPAYVAGGPIQPEEVRLVESHLNSGCAECTAYWRSLTSGGPPPMSCATVQKFLPAYVGNLPLL